MRLIFSPQLRDDQLELHRVGDVLTINGEPFDFGPLPDGATLPMGAVGSDWVVGSVERIDGVIHVHVILPYGPNAPEETRWPEPITLTDDGPVDLPVYDIEPEPEFVEAAE